MRFSKAQIMMGLLLIPIMPWWAGGRDANGRILSFAALTLAALIAWHLPEFKRPKLGYLGMVGLGFIVVGCVSALWSVNRYQTVSWSISIITAAVGLVLAAGLAHDKALRNAWIRGYLWIASAFSLYGVWLYIFGSYERLTSTFWWANPYAGYLLPAVLISLWQFAADMKREDGIIALIVTTSFFLTQSRGALLVLIVTLLGAVFLKRDKRMWGRGLTVLVLAIVVSLGTTLVRTKLVNHSGINQGSRFAEALKGESQSGHDRLNYLKSSANIMREHPYGTGAGTFSTVYPQYQLEVVSAVTDAHNVYVQWAVELGVWGRFAIVIFCLLLIGLLWETVRKQPSRLVFVVGLAALLLHFGLDIDASYPACLMLAALLIGWSIDWEEARGWHGTPFIVCLLLAMPVVSLYASQTNAMRGGWKQDDHDYQKAAEYYGAASQGVAYNPDVLTSEGINYFTLGQIKISPEQNFALAKSRAEQAIELDPQDSQHYFLLARVLRAQGDAQGAFRNYRKALELDPLNSPEYYLDIAGLDIANGQLEDAKKQLDTAINLYPDKVIRNRMAQESLQSTIDQIKSLRAVVDKLTPQQ